MKNKDYEKAYKEYIEARNKLWKIRDQAIKDSDEKKAASELFRSLRSIRASLTRLQAGDSRKK